MAVRIFIPTPEEHEARARRLYGALREDGCLTVCLGSMTEDAFVALTRAGWLILGEDEDEDGPLGYLLLRDFEARTARLHFGLLRSARVSALEYARQAFALAFGSGRLDSIYGIFPAAYRHVPPFARRLGGLRLGEIPGAAWDNIRNRPVPGVAWVFRKEEFMGFGGGGGGSDYVPPAPEPTPKQQVQKPVTEAATAARQAQKDRAAKAAGIQGSILTGVLNDTVTGAATTTGKRLLGQ